jgi:hypothetical protein
LRDTILGGTQVQRQLLSNGHGQLAILFYDSNNLLQERDHPMARTKLLAPWSPTSGVTNVVQHIP